MILGRGPDLGYRRCDAEIKATWASCADHAAAARASEAPRSQDAAEALVARRRRHEAARAARDAAEALVARRRRHEAARAAREARARVLGAGGGRAVYMRRSGGRLAVPVAHARYSLAPRLIRGGAEKSPAAPAPPSRLRARYLHAHGCEKLRAAARPPPDAPQLAAVPPPRAAAPSPPPQNIVVTTVVGWRGAGARGCAGAVLRVFLVSRGGRRLVGEAPLALHLDGAVATGPRVSTIARPGDRYLALDIVGPAAVVASRTLRLDALATDGDVLPRWVRFAKDTHVMLGVHRTSSREIPPPPKASSEAVPAAPLPPPPPPRTDWLSAGLNAGPVLIELVAVRAPGNCGIAAVELRAGAGLTRRVVGNTELAVGGASLAVVERGAALRVAVRGAGAADLRFHGDAWAGQRRLALRGGAAPASSAAVVVRATPLAGKLVTIKIASAPPPGPTPLAVAPPEPWACLVHAGALHCFRVGAGFARIRVALAGAAVERVAVRGATLVLAVAPPAGPPGRTLLDASGLNPDAAEAFAAAVSAAADAAARGATRARNSVMMLR